MRELDGVSVVVTGASSGIGRAAALAFAKRGACITLATHRVAQAMVALALQPRRSVMIGGVATLTRLGYFVAPRSMRAVMTTFIKAYLAKASRSPITDANVRQPIAEGHTVEAGRRFLEKRSLAAGLALAAGAATLLLAPRAARGARS